MLRRTPWLRVALWVGALAALMAVAYLVDPYDPAHAAILPRCLFYSTTGLHCPGCGVTRALHDLVHGRWLLALSNNVLLVLVGLPLVVYNLGSTIAQICRGPSANDRCAIQSRPKVSRALIITLYLMVVAFWILRNVPYEPLAWLAPITSP